MIREYIYLDTFAFSLVHMLKTNVVALRGGSSLFFSARAEPSQNIFEPSEPRAFKFLIRAYFKPKNTSVYLTTTSKLGSH